jgi:hypothetical protein
MDHRRVSTKKGKWRKMSEAMNRVRPGCTDPDKCRLKIKYLKDKYTNLKNKSNRSGGAGVKIDTMLSEAFSVEMDTDATPKESSLKRGMCMS